MTASKGQLDFEAIRAANPIVDTIQSYIELRRDGREYRAPCPFHEDTDPSFTVMPDTGKFYCFGCEAKGDVIDFVAKHTGVDVSSAAKALGNGSTSGWDKPTGAKPKKVKAPDPKDIYEPFRPLHFKYAKFPDKEWRVFNPKRNKWADYTPSSVYPYHNAVGQVIAVVLRIDLKDGKKITPLVRWVQDDDGDKYWCHHHLGDNRPLYNLHKILDLEHKDRPIVICEGEKAADAASKLLPAYVATTNQGGSAAVSKANLGTLVGRHVLVWPDADKAGAKWGAWLRDKLAGRVKVFKHLDVREMPDGWDAADFEGNHEDFMTWARPRVRIDPGAPPEEPDRHGFQTLGEMLHTAQMPHLDDAIEHQEKRKFDTSPPLDKDTNPPRPDEVWDENMPFKILGYDKGIYYFLPRNGTQVVDIPSAGLNKNRLADLAGNPYWFTLSQRLGSNGKGIAWEDVSASLKQQARRVGVYKGGDKLRGAGVWYDQGRVVVHRGSGLTVSGVTRKLFEFKDTHFIYEETDDLVLPIGKPATVEESRQFYSLCERLQWDTAIDKYLLAGWCVLAPACGAFDWRPHIWITGESGSGKSVVMDHLIKPTIGPIALDPQGNTTEAGIRQELGCSARPIIFDEAEPEGRAGRERMRAVLELIRASSSGGKVTKGSATGKSVSYTLRSMFCLSAIAPSDTAVADESRISKLLLRKDVRPDSVDLYKQWYEDCRQLLTSEFAASMLSRTICNIDNLIHNAGSFIEAGTRVFGSKRTADQHGWLLAGAYLCKRNGRIDVEDAEKWMRDHAWEEHSGPELKGYERFLAFVANHAHRYQPADSQRTFEFPIGALIIRAASHIHTTDRTEAAEQLGLLGIKLSSDRDRVMFANNSPRMQKLLRDTEWTKTNTVLRSVPEHHAHTATAFGHGVKSRSISVPIEMFELGESQPIFNYEED